VRQNKYRLANRLTEVSGAAHISQSASTMQSGDTRLSLNFWQRVIKERQENFIHAILS
jgi:hypothetical protein